MAPRFTYSRWDGTQVGFELDAERIFEEITDDLLYHGDINAALTSLQLTSDGVMDEVHALRDQYGADLVCLIDEDSNACGVGYVMTTVSPSFTARTISIPARRSSGRWRPSIGSPTASLSTMA